MIVILAVLLTVLNIVVIDGSLYGIGHLAMKRSKNGLLPRRRKLGLLVLVVLLAGAIEALRYLIAAAIAALFPLNADSPAIISWLVYPTVYAVPLVPAVLVLSLLIAFINGSSIAACDRCNEWTIPFGGVMYGSSWGSPDLICLKCLVTVRRQGPLLYPLLKAKALLFWVFHGAWQS